MKSLKLPMHILQALKKEMLSNIYFFYCSIFYIIPIQDE